MSRPMPADPAMPDDDGARIPTNLRTLLILEVLGRSDRPLTATEINEQLGLPKQTVHRLCKTLEEEGFLSRQSGERRYHAARRLRDLGTGLLYNSRTHIARHQILQGLAQAVGETVNFSVPEKDGMSYLDRVETDWAFRIQLPIGSHVPFHCTASGKCFLASLAPKARETLVSSLQLERKTAHTHTTPDSLLKEIADIARDGYALDREEFMEDMVALAVPVTDAQGRYMASLSFHGPTQRISIADAIELKCTVQAAANDLRRVL
ncbi:MAG: IclR family transcriptional regulator [Pseudomonadota bacterium]